MHFYFDIETVPSQMPGVREEFVAAVTAPAQYKKPESIAEWLRENREAEGERAWLQTSFDGGLGQICVIGWALNDGDLWAADVSDMSADAERRALQTFFRAVEDAHKLMHTLTFVGHNVIGFDFPFIWKRAMVLGVKPPFFFPRNPKPWSDVVVDTMLLWDPTQRAGGSIGKLCRALGIEGKGDMDGSKVWPMVRDGRIGEVADYCRDDVDRTRKMHKRMTFAEAEQRRQAEEAARAAAAEAAARAAAVPQSAPIVSPPAPIVSQTAPVVPQQASLVPPAPAPRPEEPAALKLGDICARFGAGFTMTEAFVATTLGVQAQRTGAAKLYRESDFARICSALQALPERVYAKHARALAEVA